MYTILQAESLFEVHAKCIDKLNWHRYLQFSSTELTVVERRERRYINQSPRIMNPSGCVKKYLTHARITLHSDHVPLLLNKSSTTNSLHCFLSTMRTHLKGLPKSTQNEVKIVKQLIFIVTLLPYKLTHWPIVFGGWIVNVRAVSTLLLFQVRSHMNITNESFICCPMIWVVLIIYEGELANEPFYQRLWIKSSTLRAWTS